MINCSKMTTKSQNQVATKEDIKEFRGDVKNYIGALHERFTDEVKIVAEQYGGIDKRLNRLESKTDMIVETVGDMKVDMTVMKEDMTEMKGDISELKTDMKEVKEELLPGATKKVDKLERRVVVLESRT